MKVLTLAVCLFAISVVAGWFAFGVQTSGKPNSVAFVVFALSSIAFFAVLVLHYFRWLFTD